VSGAVLATIGLKAIVGGMVVILFAVIGTAVKPKQFSGIFSAAPSVAVASLLIASLSRGPMQGKAMALGMLAGSVGMIAYCLVGTFTIARWHALLGSLTAYLGWLAASALVFYGAIR
jgi:uncharacterized membrane protein (GlpM family)